MGNCCSSVGDGERETSVDGCRKIQKCSRQSSQRKRQKQKDIKNRKLETSNGWSIEVKECSKQSSERKSQKKQKDVRNRKLETSEGWYIEVQEISRVSPVRTSQHTQNLNKNDDSDSLLETSNERCLEVKENLKVSPPTTCQQMKKKKADDSILETPNERCIEVQEISRVSPPTTCQQMKKKKAGNDSILETPNERCIEVQEISRVSPVRTSQHMQNLNKNADNDSLLETSNERCLEVQENLKVSPPTTCKQMQKKKTDNDSTLETSNERCLEVQESSKVSPQRRSQRRRTRTPNKRAARDIRSQILKEREDSFKFVPAPTLSYPIQVQSRDDFLLKDHTLAKRKNLPSLAASILSLFKENQNLSAQYWKVLPADDDRYITIENLFRETTRKHFPVKIEVVENPFLKAFYLLKKKEYTILYGAQNVREELLFHGTKKRNVTKIIKNNFNWRLHGEAKGHIFGMGMSFSPISNYSTNYCENSIIKVIILAQVLVSQECVGTKDMGIPPRISRGSTVRFDSSIKPNRAVIVKYNDDEFYPNYIIQFKDY